MLKRQRLGSKIKSSNDSIQIHIAENNHKLNEITQVIQEIGNKTRVINDIVFQTKLLSFNASVEAARAGDAGKGFAVVAEEVGNLAQMSGNAAKEISEMLESSIKKVESMAAETQQKVEVLMNEASEKVELGSETAKVCEASLDQIVENVNSVSISVAEIASASNEQAKGVEEIAKAIAQIDMATQTNSSVSNNTAQAAQRLTEQAKSVVDAAETLRMIVEGRN